MKQLLLVFLASLLGTHPFDAHAEIQLQGADGTEVVLKAPAQRVAALAPDLAELMFDAGAGADLVATVRYTDYPAAAAQVDRVGDAFHVDLERLLALKPDLVLAWQGGTPVALVEKIRSLGLPVLTMGTHDLADIAANLELLGRATGHGQEAVKEAQAFRDHLERLRTRYANRTPIRVFYEISAEPLYTVGGGQSISRLLEVCGARNVFADLAELAPVVGMESVLARDPQAVVTGGDADSARRIALWRRWPRVTAVREGNLFTVPDDLIARATPRLLDAGDILCVDLEQARERLAAH